MGGEPDAIATVASNLTSRALKIVIEVKHGAGKSGGDQDQLVKYYSAAVKQYANHDILLIYLTHHRDMPIEDLKASLDHLTDKAPIYWLSWYDIVEWSEAKLQHNTLSISECRVLKAVNEYLVSKGYRRFRGWQQAISHHIEASPLYTRCYVGVDGVFGPKRTRPYVRSYLKPNNISTIPTIYKPRGGMS